LICGGVAIAGGGERGEEEKTADDRKIGSRKMLLALTGPVGRKEIRDQRSEIRDWRSARAASKRATVFWAETSGFTW
jgi:hypothetical protein